MQTNLYASQKNKTFGVTVNELKVFIGGMLFCAICPLQNMKSIGLQKIMFPSSFQIACKGSRGRVVKVLG